MDADRFRQRLLKGFARKMHSLGALLALVLLLAGSLALASAPGFPQITPPGDVKQTEEPVIVITWPPDGAVMSATTVVLSAIPPARKASRSPASRCHCWARIS